MEIRKARPEDFEEILRIYAYARKFMADTGNPTQWGSDYPAEELLKSDMSKGELYVVTEGGKPGGVFAFPIGPDPTYNVIEEGEWLNDELYGTIHRIAGDGSIHGLLRSCVDFGLTMVDTIRIDTHHDNKVMQHLIDKCGFTYCGRIYARDGSPRLAYQL